MGYAILRAKKLKSMASVAGSAKHTFRDNPTPNADAEMTPRNRSVGAQTTAAVMSTLQGLLPEKRRSDAVLCIEYLVTASPEDFARHGGSMNDLGQIGKGGPGYFNEALKFLREKHGAANVISSTVHLDEKTPHMVVYVVPLTADKRLSCKDFLGGKDKLRKLQTAFYERCGKPFGLDRGIEGSKAKHEAIATHYGALAAAGEAPALTRKDYAAAAVGIETEAWKQAQQIVKAQAAAAATGPRQKKANSSRAKALDGRESVIERKASRIVSAGSQLKTRTAELNERERELEAREGALRAAELAAGAEKARADALERRLALLTAEAQPTPSTPLILKKQGVYENPTVSV